MVTEYGRDLLHLTRALEGFLEPLALVQGHEEVNAGVHFFDALFSREIDTPADGLKAFDFDHLRAPGFNDVERSFKAGQDMGLILRVDKIGSMRKYLSNILIVEAVNFLAVCKGMVEHVHDY